MSDKILELVPLTNLSKLKRLTYKASLDMNRWREIDNILMREKFKSLQKVEVWPKVNLQYLSELNTKGVLVAYQNHSF
ncbi:hypothetical protein QCA50_015283 [Cerrena zonata]|uniref:Uncharacterized protein n=1 Tax=Cerrena zonata TaxID=2478898 RepID=A0AAW0FLC5_9APHY